LSIALGSTIFKKEKNGAPQLGNFIAHFGRLMMCLLCLFATQLRGKKTFSGKGTENYAL